MDSEPLDVTTSARKDSESADEKFPQKDAGEVARVRALPFTRSWLFPNVPGSVSLSVRVSGAAPWIPAVTSGQKRLQTVSFHSNGMNGSCNGTVRAPSTPP